MKKSVVLFIIRLIGIEYLIDIVLVEDNKYVKSNKVKRFKEEYKKTSFVRKSYPSVSSLLHHTLVNTSPEEWKYLTNSYKNINSNVSNFTPDVSLWSKIKYSVLGLLHPKMKLWKQDKWGYFTKTVNV